MADNWEGWSPKAGATSQSTVIRLISSAGAGVTGKLATNLTASYLRQGGVRVAITLSDLAAVNSAYSSGGVKEIDATNFPGLYRLDLPDTALATGVEWLILGVVCSGSIDYMEKMILKSTLVIDVSGSVATVLSKLLKYVQLILRKDAAIATDNAPEVTAINANGGSGTGAFSNQTDATEALRDRGDSAWITATGFAVAGDIPSAATNAAAVLDVAASSHNIAGSIGEKINNGGAGGSGTGTIVYTFTVTDGVNPLDGVFVEVSTDSGKTNVVRSGYTIANGTIVFNLDPADYYFWKNLSGYNFTNPELKTVS